MQKNIGRYKDRDRYLAVASEIVDELSHNVLQILTLSPFRSYETKKRDFFAGYNKELIQNYSLLAKERKLLVQNQLTNQQASLNPSALKLILSNLLSNAIKHSTQGGYVRIAEKEGWISIENSCNPEEQENLSNPS